MKIFNAKLGTIIGRISIDAPGCAGNDCIEYLLLIMLQCMSLLLAPSSTRIDVRYLVTVGVKADIPGTPRKCSDSPMLSKKALFSRNNPLQASKHERTGKYSSDFVVQTSSRGCGLAERSQAPDREGGALF